MVRGGLVGIILLGLCGCLSFLEPTETTTPLVSADPFGQPVPPPTARSHFAPASTEMALRVDRLGRDILAANPHIGLKPLFATIGAPQAEIFHQGLNQVNITEGLIRRCPSDAELAALLCYELGKMVAQREALAGPELRKPEKRPPINVPIGNAGHFSSPDLTPLAELGRFEKENPRRPKSLPPPDPRALAQTYLENAGFKKEALTAVDPLLQDAQRNFTLEKQFRSVPNQPIWKP